jgi:hypothetical protein
MWSGLIRPFGRHDDYHRTALFRGKRVRFRQFPRDMLSVLMN